MGLPVLVYGRSGSGKSRSLKFFDKDEIVLINVEGKELPFRGGFTLSTNLYRSKELPDPADFIVRCINKVGKKAAVIDDAGYIMTHLFMGKHRNKKGNASFEMYDDIADTMYNLVKKVKDQIPRDVIVYIILHEDIADDGSVKLKTLGKLLDNKVCVEGMVTICLRCMVTDMGKHIFRTTTNGNDITKTPEDMFPGPEIDNNLKYVDDTIRDFYGWEKYKKNESEEIE